MVRPVIKSPDSSRGLLNASRWLPTCAGEPNTTNRVAQGGFSFFEPQDLTVSGAENATSFREEVFGKDFSVAIPGLVGGKYTVEIQAAEE